MGTRAARLALAAVSICAALLLAESAWRLFCPRPGFSRRSELSTPGMIVPHPRRGYTLAAGWSGRMAGEGFDVSFRTDALGCRVPAGEAGDDLGASLTILALGDSFTFGHGLDAEAAWPALLGRRLATLEKRPVRVLNGAVSGYDMTQVRDRAEELVLRTAPQLLVLGLFLNGAERMGNPYVLFEGDIVRKNARSRLRAVDSGFLRTPMNRPRLQSLHFWLGEHFYVGAALLEQSYRGFTWACSVPARVRRRLAPGERPKGPTEAGERAYLAPLLEEVGRLDGLARARGARLVVLVVNVQGDDGRFREIDARFVRIAEEYCRDRRIPLFDPTPVFQSRTAGAPVFRYSAGDGHWSAAAQALAAEELAAFLEREGLVPASGG